MARIPWELINPWALSAVAGVLLEITSRGCTFDLHIDRLCVVVSHWSSLNQVDGKCPLSTLGSTPMRTADSILYTVGISGGVTIERL